MHRARPRCRRGMDFETNNPKIIPLPPCDSLPLRNVTFMHLGWISGSAVCEHVIDSQNELPEPIREEMS